MNKFARSLKRKGYFRVDKGSPGIDIVDKGDYKHIIKTVDAKGIKMRKVTIAK